MENNSQNKKDDKSTPQEKERVIIVNGKQHIFLEKEISFDELVILAFGEVSENPNVCYTVTYKRGPNQNLEGSITEGESVKVKKEMIFNVTSTDKS